MSASPLWQWLWAHLRQSSNRILLGILWFDSTLASQFFVTIFLIGLKIMSFICWHWISFSILRVLILLWYRISYMGEPRTFKNALMLYFSNTISWQIVIYNILHIQKIFLLLLWSIFCLCYWSLNYSIKTFSFIYLFFLSQLRLILIILLIKLT
jgi:hypothetical protein